MALCNQLESQFTAGQTESGRLLESVLHHALNGEGITSTTATDSP
jgi:hypothetical protein